MSEFDGQEKLEFPNELENHIFDELKAQGERPVTDSEPYIEMMPADLTGLLGSLLPIQDDVTNLFTALTTDFPHPTGSQYGILIEQSEYPKLRKIIRDTLYPVLANSEEKIINLPEDEN